ncbi:MAG: solute carrier family 23 protein [Thermodesulfobacteriota bacterium]
MARRPENLLYAVEDKPPFIRLVLLGIQNTILIAIYLVYIVIITKAAGSTQQTTVSAISMGMIAVAIATVLQSLSKGPIGSGYFSPPVYSAIYLGPSVLAAKAGGLPAVFGMTIFAGLVELLLSGFLHKLRPYFPPAVSGFIILIVGIQLGLVGLDQVLDIANYDDPKFIYHVVISVLSLSTIIALSVWAKGLARLLCSLIGILVGFVISIPLGLISSESVSLFTSLSFIDLPNFGYISYSFDYALIPAFLTAGLAAALRTIGVITTSQKINDDDWKKPDIVSIKKGVLADGIGCILGGVMGTPGMNSSPSIIGVAKATGATSRYIALPTAIILIALAFFPKISSFFLMLPLSVIGAALLVNAAFMISGGMEIITSRNIDSRMSYIIGIPLLLGISRKVYPHYYEEIPKALQLISNSVLSLGVIAIILLNILFRIGIKQRKVFVFDESDSDLTTLKEYLHSRSSQWQLDPDVIQRATNSTKQVIEHIREAKLHNSNIGIKVSYDQLDLQIDISYEGVLLSLPNISVKAESYVEEEAFAHGLADFLTGVYPDRYQVSSKKNSSKISLFFNVM